MLAERRGVGIVVEHRRGTQTLFDEFDDRELVPAVQVGRRENETALAVERAGAPDADSRQGQPGLTQHALNLCERLFENRVRPTLAGAREEARLLDDSAFEVGDGESDFSPADVYPGDTLVWQCRLTLQGG